MSLSKMNFFINNDFTFSKQNIDLKLIQIKPFYIEFNSYSMIIIQLKKFITFIYKEFFNYKSEKPPEITAKGWDIYFRLSILFDKILVEIKNYEISELAIVEAGIGYGDTFTYLSCIAEKLNLKIIGFDSFYGFPEPKTENDQRKKRDKKVMECK